MPTNSGIEIVYRPEDRKPIIDLVFLHGTNTDWRLIWPAISDSSSSHPLSKSSLHDHTSVNDRYEAWFEIALPRSLPNARIGLWRHAVIDTRLSGDTPLEEAGKAFTEALGNFRDKDKRPIIFLTHSVGGMVLKEALVRAASKDGDLLSVTKSLIFFDNFGSDSVSAWNTLMKSIGPSKTKVRDWDYVKSLDKLDRAFKEVMKRNTQIRLCFIYKETLRQSKGSPFSAESRHKVCVTERQLLPPDVKHLSGLLVTKIAVQARHSDSTRIEPGSKLYEAIVDELLKVIDAPTEEDVNATATLILPEQDPMTMSATDHMPDTDISMHDGRNEVLTLLQKEERVTEYRQLQSALYFYDGGYYGTAEIAYREVIQALTKTPMRNSEVILFCRDKLTSVLYALGKYELAAEECKKVEDGYETLHSKDSTSILRTARNRAMLYRVHGQFDEAYRCLADTLEDMKDLKPYEYDWIIAVDLLAKILKDKEQYALAEFLLREVLEASSSKFGALHDFTLIRLSEISSLMWSRGQHRRAEEASWFAYCALRADLGPDHPSVLRAAKRYANFLHYQGRLNDAINLLHDILPRMVKRLGKNHPATLWTSCGVAAGYILQGYIAEGGMLLETIYDSQQKFLPEWHSDRLWSKQVLYQLQDLKDVTTKHYPYSRYLKRLPRNLEDLLRGPKTLSNSQSHVSDQIYHKEKVKRKYTWETVALPNLSSHEGRTRSKVFCGHDIDPKKTTSINATGGYFGSLLHAAAFSGNAFLVRRLLEDKRTKVDIKQGIFVSPLKAAAISGNLEVVKLLLDQADISLESDSAYLTILEVAILFEHHEVVHLLLNNQLHSADPNRKSLLFGNALCQAAPIGNSKIVKELLTRSADINVPCPFSLVPIQEAGLAAGDAAAWHEDLKSEYLLEQHRNLEEKQIEILMVVDLLIPKIEEAEDIPHKTDTISIAVDLIECPDAPPPPIDIAARLSTPGLKRTKNAPRGHGRAISDNIQPIYKQDWLSPTSLSAAQAEKLFRSGSYPGNDGSFLDRGPFR